MLAAAGYPALRAEQARRRESGGHRAARPRDLGLRGDHRRGHGRGDGPGGGRRAPARPPCSPAVPRTGRGTTPPGRCWSRTSWASRWSRVTVVHGDTDAIPEAIGTFGSRSLQLGGTAVVQAAGEVKEQARRLAAEMIEAAEADLELDTVRGTWQVRGDPASALGWAQIAERAGPDGLAADAPLQGQRADVPVRRAPGRGGGGHRDRQGDAGAARDRGRRREDPQPGARRGPAARRHSARCCAGAARRGALRRRRQPADQHAGGLRGDHRDRAALVRAGRQRDPDHHQPARAPRESARRAPSDRPRRC